MKVFTTGTFNLCPYEFDLPADRMWSFLERGVSILPGESERNSGRAFQGDGCIKHLLLAFWIVGKVRWYTQWERRGCLWRVSVSLMSTKRCSIYMRWIHSSRVFLVMLACARPGLPRCCKALLSRRLLARTGISARLARQRLTWSLRVVG